MLWGQAKSQCLLQPVNWMPPLTKSSRSPLALAVPLQKAFKIRVDSAFLWIFQSVVNKNFARRLTRLLEKYQRHPPSPMLRRTERPRLQQRSRRRWRRRVSSCRSSKSQQDPIDHFAQRSPTEGNEDNEEFQIDYNLCIPRCLL